jgi:glyoxylase-like metal-dependent hydrolase (beta-lactamase superfamily II)
MIEEVLPTLYRIEVPLPRNPLKALNSYIIKGPRRNLIIDTGMNREECLSVMRRGLTALDIDLNATDFFITHLHADHSGLITNLATSKSTLYCGERDAEFLKVDSSDARDGHWQTMVNFAGINGFPQDQLGSALAKHPGYKYGPRGRVEFKIVRERDTIAAGDFLFECVETPGHTDGHICLYDRQKKLLLSGDHILGNITPVISAWSDNRNPLREYLASLDKIRNLDIALVLPGHRHFVKDCKARIRELQDHHEARAAEVVSILKNGEQDAYQVASQMTWDIDAESWDLFPTAQKWFALGEAIAHLNYVEEQGIIVRQVGLAKSGSVHHRYTLS